MRASRSSTAWIFPGRFEPASPPLAWQGLNFLHSQVKRGKKPPKHNLEEVGARSDPPSWARGYAELQREMEAEAEQETISEGSEGSPEVASLRMRS